MSDKWNITNMAKIYIIVIINMYYNNLPLTAMIGLYILIAQQKLNFQHFPFMLGGDTSIPRMVSTVFVLTKYM